MKLVNILKDKEMRKKEEWMKIGAAVLANGIPGRISAMQVNENLRGDGIDYVYYIEVKLEGKKFSAPYHPNDIAEGKIVAV